MDKEVRVAHPTIHSIQYLRAVAALMVVFHHLIIQIDVYEAVLHSISVGAAGVDVFFVISGFVIWFVTYGKEVSAGEFFAKRVIRVVPIYWLITLVIAVAATAAPHLFQVDPVWVCPTDSVAALYSALQPGATGQRVPDSGAGLDAQL